MRARVQGWTWSIPEATPLPNPDSKVQLSALGDGSLVLAHNNHPRVMRSLRRVRTDLDVSLSHNQVPPCLPAPLPPCLPPVGAKEGPTISSLHRARRGRGWCGWRRRARAGCATTTPAW
jgi:hypothetical protein